MANQSAMKAETLMTQKTMSVACRGRGGQEQMKWQRQPEKMEYVALKAENNSGRWETLWYRVWGGNQSLKKRAVKTTAMTVVHFYFNHLQEGGESPLPELFDLLARWVSCCGNRSQENCQRRRKSVHRYLRKLCKERWRRQPLGWGEEHTRDTEVREQELC